MPNAEPFMRFRHSEGRKLQLKHGSNLRRCKTPATRNSLNRPHRVQKKPHALSLEINLEGGPVIRKWKSGFIHALPKHTSPLQGICKRLAFLSGLYTLLPEQHLLHEYP